MARDLRRAPFNEIHRLHRTRERGKCDWCGKPCEERTPVRKQLKLRHGDCDVELQTASSPEAARRLVFDRDGGVCVDCGGAFSEMSRFRAEMPVNKFTGFACVSYIGPHAGEPRPYTRIIWISMWHVDHVVPLWKVQHLPAAERIKYFLLPNLLTRCDKCHARKSKREAAERAHFDRLAARDKALTEIFPEPLSAYSKPKRKMRSRPFPKASRPMRWKR